MAEVPVQQQNQVLPSTPISIPKASQPNPKNNIGKRNSIIIFVVFLLISFITIPILFGGADSVVAKMLGLTSESGLAGGAIVSILGFAFIPISALINTTLSIIGLKLLRSENLISKIASLALFGVVVVLVATPTYLTINAIFENKAEETSNIEGLDFEVYKPTSKPQGTNGVSNELICSNTGIKYTYYGSINYVGLYQVNSSSELSCNELSTNEYEKAEAAALSNSSYKLNEFGSIYYPVLKEVNGQSIIIVRIKNEDKNNFWFTSLLAIKEGSLIKVEGGNINCTEDSECEQSYIDFFSSLEN